MHECLGISGKESAGLLGTAIRSQLLAAATALARHGPVSVTFATAPFGCLIDNWFQHAVRAGMGNALLIATDDTIAQGQVPPGCTIVRADFHGGRAAFWLFRLQVFEVLASEGIDFVHSDLDAIWLADPRRECFSDPALDLVFSQGTYHPEQAFATWGFVLCCGFFAVRARPATARFFAAVRVRAQAELDDQAAVNLVLVENGLAWQRNPDHYSVAFAGRSLVCHRSTIRGTSEQLGLTVGLLPHHLVPRLPTAAAGPIVKHPDSSRDPAAKIPVLQQVGCWLPPVPRRAQMLVFSYHKSGTTLLHHIMHKFAERLRLTIRVQYGTAYDIDPNADVVLLPHSLLGFQLARPFRAVRIVRDPRDIWVSGYLYHLRTNEGWCVNVDLDPTPPITYPQVDFSMLHRTERWKRSWLARLNGKSYQQNLRERDLAAGLAFELEGYTGCTLTAMRSWRVHADVLDVKLEDIAQAFDATMSRMFRHLGCNEAECEIACQIAATEDINRMDDTAIAASPQIYSRTLSKWRGTVPDALVRSFEQRHGDLLRALNYPLASSAD
jgi:Nucleotide-diphospho-sugar transferase